MCMCSRHLFMAETAETRALVPVWGVENGVAVGEVMLTSEQQVCCVGRRIESLLVSHLYFFSSL